jgi:CRISPR/Cas system endoribonuclease Cas6 (RAMP superfamily)
MQTFTQFEITLAPMGTLTGWLGHLLHGALFEQLKAVKPALAQRLHIKKRKPFSLSYQEREGLLVVRLGVWDDELALVVPMVFAVGGTVLLSRTTAKVRSVTLSSELTKPKTAPLPAAFRIEFHSPTRFNSSGQTLLFPDSRHVLESLYHALALTDTALPPTQCCETMASFVHPCGYDLHTQAISFGGYTHSGFTGWCDYLIARDFPQEYNALLWELMSILPYTGIGYKTAMSMGNVILSLKKDGEIV